MKPSSSLFHVTHAKAGSTWLHNVFVSAFGRRRVAPRVGGKVEKYRFKPGMIVPAIFLAYDDFMQLEGASADRCFFVIRDIRDTLTSLYFSMRYSHTDKGFPHITKFREEVSGMSDPEGIAHLFKTRSRNFLRVQTSWLDSGAPVVRYEDLLYDTEGILSSLFDRLGYPHDPKALRKAIEANSFKKKFGRDLGEKDVKSHGRQGSPGDWKNYRSDEISRVVDEKFSELLLKAGYALD